MLPSTQLGGHRIAGVVLQRDLAEPAHVAVDDDDHVGGNHVPAGGKDDVAAGQRAGVGRGGRRSGRSREGETKGHRAKHESEVHVIAPRRGRASGECRIRAHHDHPENRWL